MLRVALQEDVWGADAVAPAVVRLLLGVALVLVPSHAVQDDLDVVVAAASAAADCTKMEIRLRINELHAS